MCIMKSGVAGPSFRPKISFLKSTKTRSMIVDWRLVSFLTWAHDCLQYCDGKFRIPKIVCGYWKCLPTGIRSEKCLVYIHCLYLQLHYDNWCYCSGETGRPLSLYKIRESVDFSVIFDFNWFMKLVTTDIFLISAFPSIGNTVFSL